MSPPLHTYSGRNFQVVLPSNLWFTNNAGAVSSIAIDFNDGSGYRTLAFGQAVTVNYADTGSKSWTFRLTLTNNATLYSHTEMKIEPEPGGYSGCTNCRFPTNGPVVIPLTADDPYLGEYGQGWISVDYANADLKLRKPLIVAEGFDPGYLLHPEVQFGETDFNSFLGQLNGSTELQNLLQGANQQYDIIYVDWKKGADYLQRNGYFLERVIRWVNEQKAIDGSVEPNVVLGQSMGGIIAHWALRDMENRSLNHQTRLFISWDAPQLGANVPLAYQHAGRHAYSLFIQSGIPTALILGGPSKVRMIKNELTLSDFPAAKQMLYNRVLSNGSLDNSTHNAWQSELTSMGYPQQCRNVAVSNGSECGIGQGFSPGDILLSIVGNGNTRILGDILGQIAMPLLANLTQKPTLLLGILPGKNTFHFEVQCNAQPEGYTMQIYKGKITYTKKVLWLVNVNTTITNRTRNSDPSVLPVDGTPGGMYDTEFNPQSSSFRNWAVKYNITASNIPQFNFVPTVSSLDIGSGNATLTMSDYRTAYVGANPPAAPKNTPFANFTTAFNQVFISNGQINNNENHIQIATRNGNFVAEELNGNINVRTNCLALCQNGVITGNDKICNTSETYTAPFGNGLTYTWFVDKPWLVTISPNGNQVTITPNGPIGESLTISVQISGICGATTLNKTVVAGVPNTPTVELQGGEDVCYDLNRDYWFVIANPEPGVSYYKWGYQKSDGTTVMLTEYGSTTSPQYFFYDGGSYTVFAIPRNDCGEGPRGEFDIYINQPWEPCDGFQYYSLSVAPNPTQGDLTVSIADEKSEVKALSKNETVQILLYDFNTREIAKKWQFKNDQNKFKLNVAGLRKGQYVIQMKIGKYSQSKQLIIN